jgi:hypothetical protein
MSTALGRLARRKDSVLPQQSWNSSQTRTGFSVFLTASAMTAAAERGSASIDAMAAQKPTKSRRETPRVFSSETSQGVSGVARVMSPPPALRCGPRTPPAPAAPVRTTR